MSEKNNLIITIEDDTKDPAVESILYALGVSFQELKVKNGKLRSLDISIDEVTKERDELHARLKVLLEIKEKYESIKNLPSELTDLKNVLGVKSQNLQKLQGQVDTIPALIQEKERIQGKNKELEKIKQEYELIKDVPSELETVKASLTSLQDALLKMVQNAMVEISDLIRSDLSTCMNEKLKAYLESILFKNQGYSNKGITQFNEYKTMDKFIETLKYESSVISQLVSLVWWYRQDVLNSKLKILMPNIVSVVEIFVSKVAIPLEICNCKINIPDCNFSRNINHYKSNNLSDSHFVGIFPDSSIENNLLCEVCVVSYNDIEGTCYFFYKD